MAAHSSVDQPELPTLIHDDYSVDERDWIAVKLLCEEIERELAERRIHLLRRLASFLACLTVFRRVEKHRMLVNSGDASPRDKTFHRAILSGLSGMGEMLLLEFEKHTEIDPVHIGLEFGDVSALVDELRHDLHMWHGDKSMTKERETEVLDALTK